METLPQSTASPKRSHLPHQICVLLLTFSAYASFHASRKPPSIVKSALGSEIPPVGGSNSTGHGWAPFDGPRGTHRLGELDLAFLASYSIGMYFAGHVGDRIDLRRFLSFGMVASGISTIAFGMGYWWKIHSFAFFLAVQIVSGVFQSIGWPCVVAVVGNWFGKSKRGLIMGIWNSHTSVGNIVGSVIASAVLEYGWGWSFLLPGCLIMVVGFLVLAFLVVSPKDLGYEPAPMELEMSGGSTANGSACGSMLTMARKNETQLTRRSPLSPSTKNGAAAAAGKAPPARVSSVALSPPPPPAPHSAPVASRRCPSPNCRGALSQKPSLPKRSQSAERRRPTTPSSGTSSPASSSRLSSGSSTPVEDAMAGVQLSSRKLGGGRTPDGLWPAMRNLSGSFQLERVPAEKPVSGSNARQDYRSKASSGVATETKRAPSRGKNSSDGSENSKPVENSHPRSKEQHQWPGIVNGRFSARASSRSVDLTAAGSGAGPLPPSSRGLSPGRRPSTPETPKKGPPVAINGGARRRMSTEILRNPQNLCERAPSLTHLARASSLPRPGSPRPSSPRKAPLPSIASGRSSSSPGPVRPSSPLPLKNTSARTAISSSAMSRNVDVCKGRKSSSRTDDEFKLRMLYNRYLQWRFVNTHADAAMIIQKITAQSILYSVWAATSGMRDSIVMKRINVQRLRLEIELGSILEHQMPHLEDWASLEREHSCSLSGAADALRASMLGLPVVGGAKADVGALKAAISSAADVMRTMGSSVYHLLSRLEGVNSVVSQLTVLATEERAMLDECMELLASTAALQVQECSLRAHLLQLRRDR